MGTASGNRLFQKVGQMDNMIKETRPREMPKEPSKEEGEHKGPNKEPEIRQLMQPHAIKVPAWSEGVTAIPGTQPSRKACTATDAGDDSAGDRTRTWSHSKPAILLYVRHFQLGRPFTAHTDHYSWLWLRRFKYPQGQLMRWLEHPAGKFSEERVGRNHTNEGPPSCRPALNFWLLEARTKLPSGGCSTCRRTEEGEQFSKDIGKVIIQAAEPTIQRIVKEESVSRDIILDMKETSPERERMDDPLETNRIAEEQGAAETIQRIVKEESVGRDIILDLKEASPERERVDDPWEPHRIAEEQGKDTVLRLRQPFTTKERHQHGRPRGKRLGGNRSTCLPGASWLDPPSSRTL